MKYLFLAIGLIVQFAGLQALERAAQAYLGSSGPSQASYSTICGKELATHYRSGESSSFQEGVLQRNGFEIRQDVAQYKGSDYANVIHVERGISLEKAFEIAEANSEIDYFVYLKGIQMVLEVPSNISFDPTQDPFHLLSHTKFRYDSGIEGQGYCRIFRHGDVVFFKKEGMWLGSAPGLADAYFKVAP